MTDVATVARGLRLKAWIVAVNGHGSAQCFATSRGAALADAWRSAAFDNVSFGNFLKIARCWKVAPSSRFGAEITVEGRPAYFIDNNRAYVRIAYPGAGHILSAHPYDVLPEEYRPDTYRAHLLSGEAS